MPYKKFENYQYPSKKFSQEISRSLYEAMFRDGHFEEIEAETAAEALEKIAGKEVRRLRKINPMNQSLLDVNWIVAH